MGEEWFSQKGFKRELATAWLGRAARVVAETGSTIDLAWSWLEEGGPEGGAVIAQRQARGRGRMGRAWASPEGGLWMSVIARPRTRSYQVGRLGVIMALAAAEGVSQEAGIAVGLKWPNDLIAAGRKLGGVLVETRVLASRVTGVVVSLGLNVNLRAADLPDEVRGTATSVRDLVARELPLESVAAAVFNRLEPLWAEDLGAGRPLSPRWEARDVLRGRKVAVTVGAKTVEGVADGIDDEGRLLLRIGGKRRAVAAGEVSLREALP